MNKLFIIIILFCSVKQAKTQVETLKDSSQTGNNEIINIDTNKIEKIIPYPPRLYNVEPYIPIEQVIIRSFVPRGNKTNTANTLISKELLELQNMGQDIPMLLQNETGIISTSDAGNGIGYTGIRVRGSDATRTNISINGVPINDAESQGVFWVNMPDLVSSTKSVFIQRGVGSSVHGSGSFGGSVLIQTESAYERSASIDYSIGSFGTEKITGKLSSGFRELSSRSKYALDLRISSIKSNGFIDRSASDLKGYKASFTIENPKWQLKLLQFGGMEKTQQAWWGIPIEKYNLLSDPTNSEKQLALDDHYNRNIGFTYRNTGDSLNLYNSNPNTYNYYRYADETDNYQQHHTHLYLSKKITSKLNFNSTVYYTFGSGYFQQYRYQDELSYYGLPPANTSDTSNSDISDIIRQRWLQNHLFGINTNLIYSPRSTTRIHWGTGISRYLGQHYGIVTGTEFPNYDNQNLPKEYYRSSGNKIDASTFIKLDQSITNNLYAYADLQLRYINHTGIGNDNDLLDINFQGEFLFFNPKIGLNYQLEQKFYNHLFQTSFSVGNREPARSDFTDNIQSQIPLPETLYDYELGYTLKSIKGNRISVNLYYMDYKNQLVLTGALNDVGTPLRKNVDFSYRRGLELEVSQILINKQDANKVKLEIFGNANFSENRIVNNTASWIDYDTWVAVDSLFNNAPIAYSPDFIAGGGLLFQISNKTKGMNLTKSIKNDFDLAVQLQHKFVGRQFLDNTGDLSRSIPAYNFGSLNIQYRKVLKRVSYEDKFAVSLKLQVNNLYNQNFLNNGYTWGYFFGNRELIQEVFVFPSATRNFNLGLKFEF